MKVEISRAQKEALGEKIALCVDFLKTEVQPHLVKSDKLTIPMSDILDLCITSKDIYVVRTRVISFFIEFCFKTTLQLEKQPRNKAKKYICEKCPELAVEFLKYWDKAKSALVDDVIAKEKQVQALDSIIRGFRL